MAQNTTGWVLLAMAKQKSILKSKWLREKEVQVNTTALESNISNIIYDIRRNPTVGDLQDDCVNFGMLRASKRCLIIILRRKSSNRKLGFRYKVNENTFRLRSSRSVRETETKQSSSSVCLLRALLYWLVSLKRISSHTNAAFKIYILMHKVDLWNRFFLRLHARSSPAYLHF